MSKKAERQLRVALIGTESLRAQEIKNLLSGRKLPLKSMEFYDPEVAEEYSKLTEFRDEPKVIHHPYPELLEGLDLVFLAADRETNRKFGQLALEKGFKAIDLEGSFADRPEVPQVVTGVNDRILEGREVNLVSNPHPVTIFMSRVLAAVRDSYHLKKVLAVVLQPVSAYGSAGIEELAEQSYALLSSSSLSHKIFEDQIAFNFLPEVERAGQDGFTASEKQIIQEVKKVLNPDFDLSLSLVQAPVFHVYSLAVYLELAEEAGLQQLEKTFRNRDAFHFQSAGSARSVSNVRVASQEKIFIGHPKKDQSLPGSFWLWVAADNLTVGSALNALDIARKLFNLG
ncbi:MAG: Asd/ArgC dimerization domain-containing protein [Candidatus Saccharicenans sp.]|nr:Asd/ArgC dimerization domain-containing protein [Candidatus Saccharicenans sp.]